MADEVDGSDKLAKLQQQIGDAQQARPIAGLAPVNDASLPVPQSTVPPNNKIAGWCYAGKFTSSGSWQDATIQQLPENGKVTKDSILVVATALYVRTSPRTDKSLIPCPPQGVILQGGVSLAQRGDSDAPTPCSGAANDKLNSGFASMR